jgi:hypothetical protein
MTEQNQKMADTLAKWLSELKMAESCGTEARGVDRLDQGHRSLGHMESISSRVRVRART